MPPAGGGSPSFSVSFSVSSKCSWSSHLSSGSTDAMRFVSSFVSLAVRFATPRRFRSTVFQTGCCTKNSRSARSFAAGLLMAPCLSCMALRFLTMM